MINLNIDLLIALAMIVVPTVLCIFGICIYCLCIVKKNEGYIKALHNAPVLREYVKEYVPIDNSEEAKKVLQKKMLETEKSMEDAFGLSNEVFSDRKFKDNGGEEDLV